MARHDSPQVASAIEKAVAELQTRGMSHDEAAREIGELFEQAWLAGRDPAPRTRTRSLGYAATQAPVVPQLPTSEIQAVIAALDESLELVSITSDLGRPHLANLALHTAKATLESQLDPELSAHASDLVSRLQASISTGPGFDEGQASSSRLEGLEREIEELYERLGSLNRDESAGSDEIEQTKARLRELQRLEAVEFRRQFETSLAVPLGAGARMLDEAKALRREREDTATQDTTSAEASGKAPRSRSH